MRDNYDFSDAIKNPFAGREKGKFVVKIHYDFNEAKEYNADAENQEQDALKTAEPAAYYV